MNEIFNDTPNETPRRHFETIGSTNEAARNWARDGAPQGAAVTAAAQSAGRGRRGRSWVSPPGKGVYLSIVWRPDSQSTPGRFTILAALAMARVVQQISDKPANFKWPNDVLLNNCKIGGVLCEAEWKDGRIDFVIVGIGLNVQHESNDLPERPIFPASSLHLESGRDYEIEAVTQVCLEALKVLWDAYVRGEWPALKSEFEARCTGINELVQVATETEKYYGIARGIDEDGNLLIATSEGLRCVVAGDVSYDI
ncbi:MAG: BirA family transcriptional regulator [Abditibacteriota bacterium]|jgi:BirA family biotin operon repressor/biotin-[acetyl-CoA-carboxylase] ligase|nr:BirA family transcriptional regulator [Abditibacteriota bacterium]